MKNDLLPYIEAIAQDLLPEGQRKKDEYWHRCPFHEDREASFSVNVTSGLASCFGCGWSGDVISLYAKIHQISEGEALKELRDKYKGSTALGVPEVIYNYHDEKGELIFQVCRFPGKQFRQRRPDGKGGYIWNLKDVKRVPYNLLDLQKAQEVIFCEGEKDADSLHVLGFTATTTPGGSNSWRDDYTPYFKDKDVILTPDNDSAGKKYMTQVGRSLLGKARSVKWLALPDLKKGEDVSDWIAKLPSSIDPNEQLSILIESAEPFTDYDQTKESQIPSFLLPTAEIVTMEINVEWVVDSLIPKSAITLFFGRGGIGKTWASLQTAKATAEGGALWDLQTIRMPVVYIDMENPLPMLRERLKKIGPADDFWVWHLASEKKPPLLNGSECDLYQKLPAGSLLIFDTLRAAHTGDENSSQDMALVMNRLKVLREQGFTILLLHHTRKGDEGIYKGSTAISDLCDHQICLENLHGDDDIDLGGGTFRLGTKDKSRFVPSEIHLTFSADDGGFVLGEDPAKARCEVLYDLLQKMPEEERYQTRIIKAAQEELGIGFHQARRTLKKGEGTFWAKVAQGKGLKAFYRPLPLFNTIEGCKG